MGAGGGINLWGPGIDEPGLILQVGSSEQAHKGAKNAQDMLVVACHPCSLTASKERARGLAERVLRNTPESTPVRPRWPAALPICCPSLYCTRQHVHQAHKAAT